jgi:YfiH family protein
VKIQEGPGGFSISTKTHIFFFGNRESSLELLRNTFPQLTWARLKQTHGDLIVQSPGESLILPEADAHWTKTSGLALAINTADCTPILIHCPVSGIVAAIHAGWRGVANRILPKTLDKLKSEGAKMSSLSVALGPHIQMSSFEVDPPVKELLLNSCEAQFTKEASVYHKGEKFHVSLKNILLAQMAEEKISLDQVYISDADTKTNAEYNSFRRDRESSHRQISFVAKLDEIIS